MNTTMQKLISVIVPIYNVGDYLEQCIHSICNQTYENLEIILVDDGSTDRSGEICDEYARRDERVKVIHKENGGASDARNAGIVAATGDYISFIDGDDWIDKNMYEVLSRYAEQNNLDVMCCQLQGESENGKQIANTEEIINFRIMNSDELLCYVISRYENSVCNRLFRRRLISDMRFPIHRCYEDIPFAVNALLRVNQGGYVDNAFYHYRARATSETGTRLVTVFSQKELNDLLPFMKEKAVVLYNAGKEELGDECLFQYLYEIISILSVIKNRRSQQQEYKSLKLELKSYRKWIMKYARSSASLQKKRILICGCCFTDAYVGLKGMRDRRYEVK